MLDRAKLMKAIEQMQGYFSVDWSNELSIACMIWERIQQDDDVHERLGAGHTPWPIPSWHDYAGAVVPIADATEPYTVIGIDGSQIYPDRHQNIGCFLINIGTVMLHYGTAIPKRVLLESVPYIFTHEHTALQGYQLSTDLVNCTRQEYEFMHGFMAMESEQRGLIEQQLLLYDGSLIFWHLDAKDGLLKQHFLTKYVELLSNSYVKQILFACYISAPKSKDIIYVIRAAHAAGLYSMPITTSYNLDIPYLIDAHIVRHYLSPATRTIVFKSNSAICALYPPELRPYFFYMHVGTEIVRVEIPAWIALQSQHVDSIARILYDQAQKGYGYPICLAEAHEQAVVHAADRDLFYHLLQKVQLQRNQRLPSCSWKLMRKRRIGF